MRRWLLVAMTVGLGPGCATLNTAGMTPHCRNLYNACLNSCPQPRSHSGGADLGPDYETPSCVSRCNERSRSCS